jgi:Family of unknown function (DUF6496)
MAKYGKKAQEKVEETMREFKEGKLRSGGSGKKVTNPKQAVAIGLSEAREAGAKVPKKASSNRTASGDKPAARTSSGGKSPRRGSSSRK